MDYLLVGGVALLVAALTLFSGFGLGTLLLPAFAVFFPVEVAIGATAVVHLANNFFKLALVGRNAHRPTLVRFAIPAVLSAFAGAWALKEMVGLPTVTTYQMFGRGFEITTTGLVVGIMIVVFALLDLAPQKKRLEFDPKWLPLGGALSGFFGGLSGHQGALRTAFLIRSGLDRDGFIGTTAVASMLVDLTRLGVYGAGAMLIGDASSRSPWPLVITACASAFVGSYVGARLVKKTTLDGVRIVVGAALLLAGVAMASGVI